MCWLLKKLIEGLIFRLDSLTKLAGVGVWLVNSTQQGQGVTTPPVISALTPRLLQSYLKPHTRAWRIWQTDSGIGKEAGFDDWLGWRNWDGYLFLGTWSKWGEVSMYQVPKCL